MTAIRHYPLEEKSTRWIGLQKLEQFTGSSSKIKFNIIYYILFNHKIFYTNFEFRQTGHYVHVFWYNKNLFCSKVYLKYKSITNSKLNSFLLFSVKIPDAKALRTRSLVHTKVAAKCIPINREETFTCSRPTKTITKSRNVRFAEIK